MANRDARLSGVLVLVLLSVLSIPGCASTSVSEAPSPLPISPSLAGRYVPSDVLVLANGMTMTIPVSWDVQLRTRGGSVRSQRDEDGVTMSSATLSGSAYASVYEHQADFAQVLAGRESLYAANRKAGTMQLNDRSVKTVVVRTVPDFGAEASATAFVLRIETGPPSRKIEVFVQPRRGNPLLLSVYLAQMPVSMRSAPDSDIPQRLIRYFNLRLP